MTESKSKQEVKLKQEPETKIEPKNIKKPELSPIKETTKEIREPKIVIKPEQKN